MQILRTPDARFAALPGFDGLRLHDLDAGPRSAALEAFAA
jgi:hypothetical protein